MNSKQKVFIKIFAAVFLLSYIAINWTDISWLFNYRAIGGLAYDFFNPYQKQTIVAITESKPGQRTEEKTITYAYTDQHNSLLIPSLSLETDVIIGQSTQIKKLEEDLEKGAVYYPGSVLPGETGQIVILGHSAPPNWPRIKHDYIFNDINNLNFGDEIILNFNNTQYKYYVREKKIIQPGQDISSIELSQTNNILTLISCWPPGKDYQRISVSAELVQ